MMWGSKRCGLGGKVRWQDVYDSVERPSSKCPDTSKGSSRGDSLTARNLGAFKGSARLQSGLRISQGLFSAGEFIPNESYFSLELLALEKLHLKLNLKKH